MPPMDRSAYSAETGTVPLGWYDPYSGIGRSAGASIRYGALLGVHGGRKPIGWDVSDNPKASEFRPLV